MDHSTLSPDELHLLYILLDSNLPTGGFVSSSGLEAYVKHGFLGIASSSSPYTIQGQNAFTAVKGVKDVIRGVTDFAEAEVEHYASTTGCFVKDAWKVVTRSIADQGDDVDTALGQITRLDEYHEASMLSHVARRASKAQGVAMLTLFARGLSRPVGFEEDGDARSERAGEIIDAYKKLVRKGAVPGHLAVCWGVITASLGLASDRSIHLYLFLHARSLLSTAVRMNIIGPYASSQLLLHPFKRIIERETARQNDASVTTGLFHDENLNQVDGQAGQPPTRRKCFWAWTSEAEMGPATTWPLGEVLMARHDMQHSRIFNS